MGIGLKLGDIYLSYIPCVALISKTWMQKEQIRT